MILQSTKITTLLLFRLAPGSCDFASCYAMFSRGYFSGFRGAKSCFYTGFLTFASEKHKKTENLRLITKTHFLASFWPSKWSLFLPFKNKCPLGPSGASGVDFGVSGIDFGASGVDFGASGVDFGASGIDFGASGGRFWSLRALILAPFRISLAKKRKNVKIQKM